MIQTIYAVSPSSNINATKRTVYATGHSYLTAAPSLRSSSLQPHQSQARGPYQIIDNHDGVPRSKAHDKAISSRKWTKHNIDKSLGYSWIMTRFSISFSPLQHPSPPPCPTLHRPSDPHTDRPNLLPNTSHTQGPFRIALLSQKGHRRRRQNVDWLPSEGDTALLPSHSGSNPSFVFYTMKLTLRPQISPRGFWKRTHCTWGNNPEIPRKSALLFHDSAVDRQISLAGEVVVGYRIIEQECDLWQQTSLAQNRVTKKGPGVAALNDFSIAQ